MRMHNPPHPGEILREMWLTPLNLSITQAAQQLNVSRKTLSEIVNAKAAITPEMAKELETDLELDLATLVMAMVKAQVLVMATAMGPVKVIHLRHQEF